MEKETIEILDVKGAETTSLLNHNTEEIPLVQVTQLPSGFKGYPKGTQISYRPITLGELEALNSDEMDATRAVAMLLKSIHCTTLNAEDLYYWDIMYIGIQRKLMAFGNTKGTIYNICPKCGKMVSKSFEYTELTFKELQAPDLPMRMTVSGKELEFKPLTMKQFLQIEVEQGELGVYARMIANLEFEEAYKLVKNAIGVDIKKLRFADQQLDYGIKPFKVKCPNPITIDNPNFDEKQGHSEQNPKQIVQLCNEEVVLEVRSPFEVVFPEDEFDGNLEFEIQYG